MNEEKDTSMDNRTSEIRFLNGFTVAKTDFDRFGRLFKQIWAKRTKDFMCGGSEVSLLAKHHSFQVC